MSAQPAQRFASRRAAWQGGMRDALGAPVVILFAGMVGFGALGRNVGLDVGWLTLMSALIYALPGQLVLVEMWQSGATGWAIAAAVTLTSTRFVTMVLTLFPQLHRRDHTPRLYAGVHLLAMTAWALSMRAFAHLPARHRLSYFIGLALPCWLVSVPGTVLGYAIAGWVPPAVNLGLVFINPLFFLLTFVDVKPRANQLAIVLGGLLGPALYVLDADSSLLLSGLCAGSLAYAIDRRQRRWALQRAAAQEPQR